MNGHLDINIYVDLFNAAYDLLPEEMDNDQRCVVADAIVTFAREHAEMIVAAVQGHAEAARLIAEALRTADLEGLLPPRRERRREHARDDSPR